ncbi:AsmA family protein [Dysgonomonas sp. 216]|uniref:AsmA-like C-terminal region-containing protein n=1 Tax=Dysgonomonas sp. 216 TaxID=2302934 RepID=UPI0013D8ACBF|nr:AsmA-like C-terminal region-containing protein [Dysgonomonas sp. 216]NDW18590.1 AsmA family protein [Dysgonomonas sp. 216]
MKKGLKIVGIILAVILILMISIPFLFKGKIKDAVVYTANKELNAELGIGNFGLNLFSNFPNATLSLDNISVSGIADFKGDTLLKAKSASATVNLMSLFNGNYELSKIELNSAHIYAKVLEDGRVNWDIVKPDSIKVEEPDEESSFQLKLQKVTLNDCYITYDDQQASMKAVLANWHGSLSGDFTADITTIKTESTIEEISFTMDGIPFMNKVKGIINADLNADLENMKFAFNKSNIQLNEIKASIDGSLAMIGESDMEFDLKLNAPDTQFKDILSILPAMYTSDFKDVKTAGTVSLDAYIKGLMDETNYPAFDVKLAINNGMFQYPSLPKSVNEIDIDVAITNKGGSLDNTIVDISKFSFNMGGNPFSAKLNIQTPISDPSLKAHLNGKIDLGIIKDVYPLESGTELNGKLTANLDIATRMSYIEKEQYESVTATGLLNVADMIYKSAEMQDVNINDISLEFTPKYASLNSLNLKIGQNDLSANGRLENYIAYAMKDQTLKGQLNIKSNYLNINDFMGGEEESSTTDTTSVGAFIVPKNIDFALNAALNKVLYDKIEMTNVNGSITVRNGAITMNNVSANALGGTGKITGSYSTAENTTKPKVNLSLNLNKVSFAETFKSVEAIQRFAPIFDKISGNYSMNLNFNTTLGESLLQILGALTGDGVLQTDDVKIEGVEALTQLSSALKLGNSASLSSFSTKDLNIPFKVEDGKITTKPFNINVGNGGLLKLEGSTSLDESINYTGSITLPKSLTNNYINNVGITIGGTFANPKIGIDTKSLINNVADAAANQLLGGSVNDKKEELTNKLSEEKAKQAQKLRDEAQKAADKLVKAADEQGQKLVSASKNVIAKAAAQTAAKKLVEEAKKQGQKLIDEADAQAKKLEEEADSE